MKDTELSIKEEIEKRALLIPVLHDNCLSFHYLGRRENDLANKRKSKGLPSLFSLPNNVLDVKMEKKTCLSLKIVNKC